jgi:SAM-dependent MidA family methyltransferase
VDLAARLRRRIAREGPLPFEEFQSACLYDPSGGFFSVGPLRSTATGDFLTSPEVSPWFGRTIARHVESVRSELAGAEPFVVAEVGAGSGSLLEPLVAALPPPAPEVWAADASPAARRRLAERLPVDRVVTEVRELPDEMSGVVIANELLDNLPVALVVRRDDGDDGWEERHVGLGDDDSLQLVAVPARPEVASWAQQYGEGTPPGGMVEVQLAAAAWIGEALRRLQRGALLIVDYGGTTAELASRRTRGTLRTYRAHHLGPDPLSAPGETDITVDVDFAAVLAAVREAGWSGVLHRQDDYLASWGLRDVLTELRATELELARAGATMERLAVRAERTDAETLLHPRGLGDFRVLVATR